MTDYITAGPVDPRHPTFIERPSELRDIANQIQRVDGYPAVLGPPDIGKTTFLCEVEHSAVWNIVSIYCGPLGDLDLAAVYRWIAEETNRQLELGLPGDLMRIQNNAEFMRFLKTAARLCQRTRLVFLIDRLEKLRSDVVRDVANTLRSVFDERHRQAEYRKIVFIFAGREGLFDLCTGNTPLNFDEEHRKFLTDFSVESTHQLADVGGLGAHAEAIYDWDAGHPCLTQKFCRILQEKNSSLTVEQVAERLLQGGEFLYLQKQIAEISGEAKNILMRIRQGIKTDWDLGDPSVRRLAFLGVIRQDENNKCVIRNRLYKIVLDDHFPQQRMQEIRVDEQSGDVWVEGKLVDPPLAELEYKLLAYLHERCNQICTRDDISIAVWGEQAIEGVTDAQIDQLVRRVRLRIEPDPASPQYIETVRGRGHRLRGCS
jgi:hypothetical protein